MHTRVLAQVLLATLACSGSSAPGPVSSGDGGITPSPVALPDGVRSGTRLKVVLWQPASGAPLVHSLHDSTLGIDCEPEETGGPSSRCVPRRHESTQATNFVYADPACRKLVMAHMLPGGAKFVFGRPFPRDSCDGRMKYYRAGALVEFSQAYDTSSGRCAPSTRSYDKGGYEMEEITERLAPMRETRDPAVGGIARIWAESDDGARAFGGWWDERRQISCVTTDDYGFRWLASDGVLRCLPRTKFWYPAKSYTDAGCTVRGTGFNAPLCPDDNAIHWNRREDACPPQLIVRVPGAKVEALFRKDRDGSCIADTTPWGLKYAIEDLDPQEMPELTLAGPRGSGRIQVLPLVSAAGEVGAAHWDSKLGSECTPVVFRGQITRCSPRTFIFAEPDTYTDAGCVERFGVHWNPSSRHAVACVLNKYARGADLEGEQIVGQVFPVVARHSGLVWKRSGGRCEAAGDEEGWRLGPETPAADLVQLTRVVK